MNLSTSQRTNINVERLTDKISTTKPYTLIEKKSKKKALIRTTKIIKTEVKIARELELLILNIILPNIIIAKY